MFLQVQIGSGWTNVREKTIYFGYFRPNFRIRNNTRFVLLLLFFAFYIVIVIIVLISEIPVYAFVRVLDQIWQTILKSSSSTYNIRLEQSQWHKAWIRLDSRSWYLKLDSEQDFSRFVQFRLQLQIVVIDLIEDPSPLLCKA